MLDTLDLAAETEAYQALLELHRAVSNRLDDEPWDAKLRHLVEDLAAQLDTARAAMTTAWLHHRLGELTDPADIAAVDEWGHAG